MARPGSKHRAALGAAVATFLLGLSVAACTDVLGKFEVDEGCETPADCPDTGSPCVLAVCAGGVCGTSNVLSGTTVKDTAPGDCHVPVCDGLGNAVETPSADDPFDDGRACTTDVCDEGAPVALPLSKGAECPEEKGFGAEAPQATGAPSGEKGFCDGKGECVECTSPEHCASGVCSADGACLPASCLDGATNGTETDKDCGGACNPCDTDLKCKVAEDCYHGICNDEGLCAAPSCSDGVQNGGEYLANNGETDIDCGGPCAAKCGPNQGCVMGSDCAGGDCSPRMICVPNCVDSTKNNGETDVDCGGVECLACETGLSCDGPVDCQSAFCVDGVCCGSPCSGTCEACSAALNTDGKNGVCGPIAAGTDPESECDPEPADPCGNSDGMCSGASMCQKAAAGAPCGSVASCAAAVQTNQDTCSGTGLCVDNGTTSCGLYQCDVTKCKTSCTGPVDCATEAYCSGVTCVPKKVLGAMCAGNVECISGSCVDGVCCNGACGGVCRLCDLAGAVGTCSNVPSGQDPDNECLGTQVCNGAQACKKVNGDTCTLGTDCLTGICMDGVCCNSACNTTCKACNLAGTVGTCTNIPVGQDPANECALACNGVGACQ